ncbi:hypothetical protein EW093_05050 [Thiospirochaeta perfilievii]|uniref:Uncharacterized protein n=1 Tax=Thiospirochaeta perfilievii TaxID=252967 RepID=A0A5C1QD10_9SPIO|nr:hypothetical protein [Thiospirochaeta perfilievii]QEN04092.1 hypothetical protein EW093_05050 [Thiospirochaeta perfilievii]
MSDTKCDELEEFIEDNFEGEKNKLLKIICLYKRVGYFEKFDHLDVDDVLTDVLKDLRVKVIAE